MVAVVNMEMINLERQVKETEMRKRLIGLSIN
jgi:hypothetical protein